MLDLVAYVNTPKFNTFDISAILIVLDPHVDIENVTMEELEESDTPIALYFREPDPTMEDAFSGTDVPDVLGTFTQLKYAIRPPFVVAAENISRWN